MVRSLVRISSLIRSSVNFPSIWSDPICFRTIGFNPNFIDRACGLIRGRWVILQPINRKQFEVRGDLFGCGLWMWEAETDIFAIQWSSLSVLVWLDKSYQIFYHIPFDLLLSSLFGVRSKEGEGNGTGINPFLLRVLLNNPRHRNQKKFRPTPSTPPSASFSLNFICFLFSL